MVPVTRVLCCFGVFALAWTVVAFAAAPFVGRMLARRDREDGEP